MLDVLGWWLALQVLGLAALPVTLKLLRNLPDRGIGLARQIGLLLAGYLFWLLTSVGLLQNTQACIVFVVLLVGGLSAILWRREGKAMWAALLERRRLLFVSEVLFLVALAVFSLFRAHNPEIAATEKPMEFGFINAILRSHTFPPRDPWLSGYALSYYYFGYVLVAMLTRLTGLSSSVTFNLAGATLFALTVSGTFCLTYNLVQAYLQNRAKVDRAIVRTVSSSAVATGMLSASFVALMGNLEGVFELVRARGWGSEALYSWLDIKGLTPTPPSPKWYPVDSWWWWRASRVVHDRNALGHSMEVIDEFPFFSFLLGDNHPHVLALPFVLLALALALNLLLGAPRRVHTDCAETQCAPITVWCQIARFLGGLHAGGAFDWILWAVCLGGLGFLNTWDYPIYLGIFVLCFVLRHQRSKEPGWKWLSDVVVFALLMLGMGVVFYFPFYLGFRSQAGGIGWVGSFKTRLHQYLVMFGQFVFFVLSLIVALVVRHSRQGLRVRSLPPMGWIVGGVLFVLSVLCLSLQWWTAALGFAMTAALAVLLIWGSRAVRGDASDTTPLEGGTLFALLLAVIGLLLTVVVEFVFLRDTFSTRMNTVFKFYYQSWVLLGIASAYGVFYILHDRDRAMVRSRWGLAAWSVVGVVLVGAGLSYTVSATVSKMGDVGEPTLDGTRYVSLVRPDDYEAIGWLQAHAKPEAVVLEAPGGSYSEYNWVSAHTGIPTLLGWGGHELQWRGNYDEPGRREPDIAAIYQGLDPREMMALLDKYGIDYVYVGSLERAAYHLNPQMIAKFDDLMTRVYENQGAIVFAR